MSNPITDNLSGKEIMIVEDNPADLKFLSNILKDVGYHVRPAVDGEMALRSLSAKLPGLILLDINLPDISGVELCQRLKADPEIRDIPVIFISALDETALKVKALEGGGIDYITKPIEPTEVIARINTHVKMYQMQKKLSAQSEELIKHRNYLEELVKQRTIKLEREINDRKQAELALRKSEEKFRLIAETSIDTIYQINLTGIIAFMNKAGLQMYGYENMSGMNFCNLVSDKYLPDANKLVSKVLSGQKIQGEIYVLHRDKHEFPIQYSMVPIYKENKIVGFSGISRDITERKLLEVQLQHMQKMEAVGTLAGGIAHDFNNMLSVITGNTSYALSIVNDDELHDILIDIQRSAKQAQNLTQQLLTFSIGGSPIKKITNLNLLIKESAKFTMRGTKTQCEFILSNDMGVVEVDEGQITQVISNLIINANQAMPEGGVLTIRTDNIEIKPQSMIPLSHGRYAKIQIEDQGIGISKKHLSKIFDPFFSTKKEGSGLGLATSYSIIKKHEGHITVNSAIDEGTIFNIYLPISSKVLKKTKKKEASHIGTGKILIMDDQESILKISGRILNSMGYETIFATDGNQAIELFHEANQSTKPFDLVILDLTIPGGIGGTETIPKLLKIDPQVKAIVSSGYSNDPVMANYQDYGFCAVMPKPYTKAEFATVLNKIFGKND